MARSNRCCSTMRLWEELLNLLEDLEDSEEIGRLRDAGEESIPWEQG